MDKNRDAARIAEYDQALAEAIHDGLLEDSGDTVRITAKAIMWLMIAATGAIPDTPKQRRRVRILEAYVRAGGG